MASSRDGKPSVRPYQRPASIEPSIDVPGTAEFSGPRVVLEEVDGAWLGVDRTELGGALYWVPRDGSGPERVSQENIQGIVRLGGRIIALSGLAFMSWDEGALLEPARDQDGQWRVGHIVPLGAAPRAFAVDPRDPEVLWIVTHEAILRYAQGELKRVRRVDYRRLDPNSLAIDSEGRLFVGMRHLVARHSPSPRGWNEDWLVPPECQSVDPDECTCIAAPRD